MKTGEIAGTNPVIFARSLPIPELDAFIKNELLPEVNSSMLKWYFGHQGNDSIDVATQAFFRFVYRYNFFQEQDTPLLQLPKARDIWTHLGYQNSQLIPLGVTTEPFEARRSHLATFFVSGLKNPPVVFVGDNGFQQQALTSVLTGIQISQQNESDRDVEVLLIGSYGETRHVHDKLRDTRDVFWSLQNLSKKGSKEMAYIVDSIPAGAKARNQKRRVIVCIDDGKSTAAIQRMKQAVSAQPFTDLFLFTDQSDAEKLVAAGDYIAAGAGSNYQAPDGPILPSQFIYIVGDNAAHRLWMVQ